MNRFEALSELDYDDLPHSIEHIKKEKPKKINSHPKETTPLKAKQHEAKMDQINNDPLRYLARDITTHIISLLSNSDLCNISLVQLFQLV